MNVLNGRIYLRRRANHGVRALPCLGSAHSPAMPQMTWEGWKEMLGWETYCGSFSRPKCAERPHFACSWPCQSAGDQISKLIALLSKVFSSLPECQCVIVCSCIFATQSADVLGASEAMRGHHHESCPRRVLQQGELWVDTSRVPGQRVRESIQGLRAVKMGLAPEFLIAEMQGFGDRAMLFNLLCGHDLQAPSVTRAP